jgi:glycerophosphoryl diester phosphodiesterase
MKRKHAWLFCLALLAPSLKGQDQSPASAPARHIAVVGHRGARGDRPENTLPAFKYAISAGVDGIEFDVHVTKDNQIVVSHDPVLHAPSCVGPKPSAVIREMTLGEVKQWDCGRKNPEFAKQVPVPGTHVPTLDEVLDLAPTGKFFFQLEIKSTDRRRTREEANAWIDGQTTFKVSSPEAREGLIQILTMAGPEMYPSPEELARLVLERVRAHHLETRVVIYSIDPRVIKAMRKLDPTIRCEAPTDGRHNVLVVAHDLDIKAVGPADVADLAHQVDTAHAEGVRVDAFANQADWDKFIASGVDAICTDYPIDLLHYLKQKHYH